MTARPIALAALLALAIAPDLAQPPAPAAPTAPVATVRVDGPFEDVHARIVRLRQRKPAGPAVACGATTKKGLPCRRKVKGGGFCYQHR